NSGTILAQLLRGMAQVLAGDEAAPHADGRGLRQALRHAADSARQAVAHPVEGTVLTVAAAAADAAGDAEGDCGAVARAAYEGARAALDQTPDQLAVLRRAGVVDAGGRGRLAVRAALLGASPESCRRTLWAAPTRASGPPGHREPARRPRRPASRNSPGARTAPRRPSGPPSR